MHLADVDLSNPFLKQRKKKKKSRSEKNDAGVQVCLWKMEVVSGGSN